MEEELLTYWCPLLLIMLAVAFQPIGNRLFRQARGTARGQVELEARGEIVQWTELLLMILVFVGSIGWLFAYTRWYYAIVIFLAATIGGAIIAASILGWIMRTSRPDIMFTAGYSKSVFLMWVSAGIAVLLAWAISAKGIAY
jgi:hypothetical protein